LQKDAVIVEAVNGDIPMSELINTGRFDFDKAYASAAWMDAMEHPEEHEDPEVLEYEITTFVYRRRQPFDLDKLNQFVASWPKNIIRVKGSIWISQDPEMSYVFEQAGKQVQFYENVQRMSEKPFLTRNPSYAQNGMMNWAIVKLSCASLAVI